jgi:hypothetical protein
MAPAEAIQQDIEGFQLVITADQQWWTSACIWRVGVVVGPHGAELIDLFRVYQSQQRSE